MRSFYHQFLIGMAVILPISASGKDSSAIDPNIIELQPFVVYSGIIDVVDGFTGKPYHESNPVVDGFREEFNDILLGYHRRILKEEYSYMLVQAKFGTEFVQELNTLAQAFGIGTIGIYRDRFLNIERQILRRLIDDPFFRIDALVVWDLDRLERTKRRPKSKYGRDIRYNEESGRWERRVTTSWKVDFSIPHKDGWRQYIDILKEQGLNLETNKGYHFINRGLTQHVLPGDFEHVRLTYPIFISSKQPAQEQVQELKEKFLENLTHIYDPFSWAWRRNQRFRAETVFMPRFRRQVKLVRFPVVDTDWFEPVIMRFLFDVAIIKVQGVDEIYQWEMLRKVPVNRNMLGYGLDLLNWNEDEDRSVPYDPKHQDGVNVNFDNPQGARFILLDAYRRYTDTFFDALQAKLATAKKKSSGKELIKEVIEEVSGLEAEAYIKKASEIQKAELEKYRFKL
ncbi:recombinase family protein [Puniceicoccales bacterium CK1056]|uniref:Recombinase family protein n=1 Tax=Oceanipulchritudo coccoides TaxID=2706888 RepID=A0A6B2LYV0_9BACT|nr:recombinase family protein [Oceanipulchritudo coccoides]NDV61236.1 recombinase family protein [Oceanipulchritudo coccoides]